MADPTTPTRTARAFDRYVLSRGVSWAGNALTAVALPVLVYTTTGDAALLGLVAMMEALPYLVLALPVGALVDGWDARRTMLVTTWLSAAATASVPLAALLGTPHPALLVGVAAAVSSLFVFFDAASFSAVPALVGSDRVGAATTRMTTVYTVIGIAGPLAGAAAVAGLGPSAVLALDAASYAAAALLLSRVTWTSSPRPSARARRRIGREILEGLQHIRRAPLVRDLTLVGAGSSLTGGAVTGTLVVMIARGLEEPADGPALGILAAAAACGTLLASRALGPIQRRVGVGAITIGGLALQTALTAAWAAVGSVLVAVLVLAAWQAATSTVSLSGIVVRQTVTPAHLQGRVNTTARMIAWGGQPIGAGLGGVLAASTGVRTAILVTGLGALAGLVGAAASGLRRAPRLADLRVPDAGDAPVAS
ncbi:MFS transporter [Clavibacter michiganensis]|uniref:Enterobactin exporter EntS n=1 Tax=Clavibacter michiganensis TaxID=28447 RepID=A0A251YTK7_9MICO|nr:MFS transporter [Clavibacter michiganensis]OUE27584.1 enterobactin exporter EntS [Clavibacter michiganensis]